MVFFNGATYGFKIEKIDRPTLIYYDLQVSLSSGGGFMKK